MISSLAVVIALPIIVRASSGQNITKCTKIIDEDGEPLIGATMMIQGSATGAVADYDGNICITGRPTDIVIISFIGYPSFKIQLANIPKEFVFRVSTEQSED